ncbi:MAG: serine/threonine protein kinase [Desulfobulbaceae bacterium]|nr:serine/threonine protein kinase [Desulfobulbaceae bacterium]
MGEVKKLNKYEVLSILGQGAMGVVYKAFDPIIERTVALKTIRKDALSPKDLEPLLTRFKHEAQAAGRLTHPGIVTVYDYGEDGDTVYIAMELVEGRELKEVLDHNERLQLSFTVNLLTQLLDALAYSHAHGVVHRDIKPGNIILLEDGRIKVTDFGIAKIESSTLTQFGDVLGTPSYMSPEQFSGQPVDRRSDLFSAGVILYHLLTGEKPFPGNSLTTIMHRVMNTIPPNVSELNFQVPAVFDQVVNKALAKKTAERFQTAEEFTAALKKAYEFDLNPSNNNGAETAVFDTAGQDEATLNLAATPAPKKPQVDPTAELHEKMEKIVDILQRQGVAPIQEDQTYSRGRSWVLTILVLLSLSLCSYAVWIIYTDDLNYEDLQLLVQEKKAEIINQLPGTPIKEEVITELSGSVKRSPESGGKPEASQTSSRPQHTRAIPPSRPSPASPTDQEPLPNK